MNAVDPLGSESSLPSKANNNATPVPDRGAGNGAQGPPRGGSGGGGDSGGEWSSDSGAGFPQLVAYLYALLIASKLICLLCPPSLVPHNVCHRPITRLLVA